MLRNLGAGLFRSERIFGNLERSTERVVTTFEIDLYRRDGGIAHLNGEKLPIKKGAILVASPGDKRYSILPFSCYYLHFETDDDQIISLMQEINGLYDYCNYEKLSQKIKELDILYNAQENYFGLKETALIIDILYEIYQTKQKQFHSSFPTSLNIALSHIENNFAEKMTVKELAGLGNISESLLQKLFVKHLGDTPNSYLIKVRLREAKKMLTETDWNLQVVSEKCGFFSMSYFCDCFKRNVGISPNKYRKMNRYNI